MLPKEYPLGPLSRFGGCRGAFWGMKDITKNDDQSFAVARRDNAFEYSDDSVKYNIFVFDGSNNPFVMSRVYDVDWICDYDMRWYPFDTQVRFGEVLILQYLLIF